MHVLRSENYHADALSRLASTKRLDNNRSIIQAVLVSPSVPKQSLVRQVTVQHSWLSEIKDFIATKKLPQDEVESKKLRRRASWFTMINGKVYKRGFSTPLLRCVSSEEGQGIFSEVHRGNCGHHLRGGSLVKKTIRAGYYWPTMESDAQEYVCCCDACQKHVNFHLSPSEELYTVTILWPFSQWGMDILGPFSLALGQLKFLVAVVDYFTKWTEAKPLAAITAARV